MDKFRPDPNDGITSLVDKAKKRTLRRICLRGWLIGKKTIAKDMVLGDYKKKYRKIRDYLQTVIDKNPGSRCIVTIITSPTEELLKEMKRGQLVFIGDRSRLPELIFCVNAAKQGFLEGWPFRPCLAATFLSVLVCNNSWGFWCKHLTHPTLPPSNPPLDKPFTTNSQCLAERVSPRVFH